MDVAIYLRLGTIVLCGQGRFQGFLSLNKVLEIGFGHKIPKLNFVSHLKISQENCRKNFLKFYLELFE